MIARYGFVLLLALPLGCKTDTSSAAPVDQPEDAESPAAPMPMAEHFVQGEQIRNAIIAGKIDDAREPAQWLVDNLETEDMPIGWRPHVPPVKRAAKKIVDAKDLAEAASAASKLAGACGSCHADTGATPKPADRPEPLQDDSTFAQMDRHAFAAERMWDALIGPNEEAWVEGVKILQEAPLHGEAAPEPVTALADNVHQLAHASFDLKPEDRPERYAEIIQTCATCHTLAKPAG